MHKEVLTTEQVGLLTLVGSFSKEFGLVGGTAIALHIGHRRSIDFDLFSFKPFNNLSIKQKIVRKNKIEEIFVNKKGEFTLVMQGVKITFFHYPFDIAYKKQFDHTIKLPDLLTLAAMKAYALGMRAKWKDYVDLFFVMKTYHGIAPIVDKARSIFGHEFNEKLFRSQLAYFRDINYEEEIVYMPGFEIDDAVVKRTLVKFSVEG